MLSTERFHDSPMSGHLDSFETWKKVGHQFYWPRRQFYWPKLRDDVLPYVRQCDLCQRAMPAQDTKVGLHTATPASYSLEFLLISWDPLICTKRGNHAILVVIVFLILWHFFLYVT